MFHEVGHPDVPLSDWDYFRNWVSPYPIEKVLDRSEAGLPDWCLPLARGAAIASSYLLRKAGYCAGSRRASGWSKPKGDELFRDLGEDCLIVQRCKPFWRIVWDTGNLTHSNFALVHVFGSTRIITRTYQEATYLAEFYYFNGPSSELHWVNECPVDISGAIDFALDRRIDEARAARSLGAPRPGSANAREQHLAP